MWGEGLWAGMEDVSSWAEHELALEAQAAGRHCVC